MIGMSFTTHKRVLAGTQYSIIDSDYFILREFLKTQSKGGLTELGELFEERCNMPINANCQKQHSIFHPFNYLSNIV